MVTSTPLSRSCRCFVFFFFNDTAPTEIYTLSLHDALPIWASVWLLGPWDLRRPGFVDAGADAAREQLAGVVADRARDGALAAFDACRLSDLKSDNVLLIDRGGALDHVKLLDFGISRFMGADAQTTQPNVLMGTPAFMAPEQVLAPDTLDCRADIYALGVVLYEMLAGRCPFVSHDPLWVLERIVHDPVPPLERWIPPALERLLFDGLLVKSRDERLQTMSEVLVVLDALIATLPSGIPEALDAFDELRIPVLIDAEDSARTLATRQVS